jgi:LPXTG-motif cell wall-anchored protein
MVRRVIVATALAVVLLAAPAAAQQYPPAVNSLTVSDTTPTPGQNVDIQARTCAPGATVTISLGSAPVVLGTPVADAAGIATLQATIPADTTLGPHTVTAVCEAPDGSELTLSAQINVVSAAGGGTGGGSGALPRTGDDSSIPLAKLGLALAAIGGVVTAVAAKRRKAAAMA